MDRSDRGTGENRNVEALRGLAALVVAYFHGRVIAWIGIQQYEKIHGFSVSLDSLLAYVTFPLVWGSIGVPVFFVISGYCIHRNHALKLARSAHYTLNARDFLLRRFIRIFPVLLAALILTLALDSASLHFFPHNDRLGDLSPATFAANLFALQGVLAPAYGSNGALWTLSLEIQFYATYPLLFLFLRRFGANRTLLAMVIVNVASYLLLERRNIIVFTSYWVSWYLGAYIAHLQTAGVRRPEHLLRAVSIVLLLAGCGLSFESQYFAFQCWALAFVPLLMSVVEQRDAQSWLVRSLAKVGEFSYSLYIIHLPIFVLLVSWLFNSRKPDSILFSIGFFVIVIAAAYVFHLCVERPVLHQLKNMSARRRMTGAGLSALEGRQ